MRPEIKSLEYHAEVFAYLVDVGRRRCDIDVVDINVSASCFFKRVDAAKHGRFSGAGRSEDYDLFAGHNVQIDSAKHLVVAEVLMQIADTNDRLLFAHRLSSPLPKCSSIFLTR